MRNKRNFIIRWNSLDKQKQDKITNYDQTCFDVLCGKFEVTDNFGYNEDLANGKIVLSDEFGTINDNERYSFNYSEEDDLMIISGRSNFDMSMFLIFLGTRFKLTGE